MKNTLSDLNNILFEALERLNDDEMDDEQLEKELKRSAGMTKVAEKIIRNADLAFHTMKHMDEYGYNQNKNVPVMLENKK